MAGIKSNYLKIVGLLTEGLVFLCRPYGDISNKLRLFNNSLKLLVVALRNEKGEKKMELALLVPA